MALMGKLSELTPSELFQLIALARKTGKLTLTSEKRKGIVLFRDGKIVFAASDSLRTALGETLSQRTLITNGEITKQEGSSESGSATDAKVFRVDAREPTDGSLDDIVRSQIESAVHDLVTWNTGRFRFEPLDLPDAEALTLDAGGFLLDVGIDSEELLLNTLTKLDEKERDRWQRDLAAASLAPMDPNEPVDDLEISAVFRVLEEELLGTPVIDHSPSPSTLKRRDLTNLRRLITEMNEMRGLSPSLTAEVTLLILRFAAQVVNRGVVFAVGTKEFQGIGQFGLSSAGEPPDHRVRHLRLPRDELSLLARVASTGRCVLGKLRQTIWDSFLTSKLGGGEPLEVVAVPLVIDNQVTAVFYGDNLPENTPIGAVDGLEILMHEIGIAVETSRLERDLGTPSHE